MSCKKNLFIIKKSSISGEGVFATRDIKKGDLIYIEKSIASTASFHIPVNNELNTYFDKPYGGNNGDLILLEYIVENIDHINSQYGLNWHNDFYTEDVQNFKDQLKFNENKMIILLSNKYKLSSNIDFIMRIYNIIIYNKFSYSNFLGDPLVNILFKSCSKFNHSCHSNCHYQLFPRHIYIIANRDINEGKELTITYGNKNYWNDKNIICRCGECNKNDYQLDWVDKESAICYNLMRNLEPLDKTISIESVYKFTKTPYKMLNMFYNLENYYLLLYGLQHKISMEQNIKNKINYTFIYLTYTQIIIDELSEFYKLDKKEMLVHCFLSFTNLFSLLIKSNMPLDIISNRSRIDINKITFDFEKDIKLFDK